MIMRRCTIAVSGLVHGVGFRSFAFKAAKGLGLKGYVENTPSGVRVVVEGYDKPINTLIQSMNKGPPRSSVENVNVRWEDPKNEFVGFEIKM